MNLITSATVVATTARANDITLFASLELSKSKWVVTINSPGSEKFSGTRSRAETALACSTFFPVEGESRAALWRADQSDRHSGSGIGRILDSSPAARQRDREPRVDAASIAVARRHRRAKTDSIDGETLLRTLMAWAAASGGSAPWFRRPARKKRIAGG